MRITPTAVVHADPTPRSWNFVLRSLLTKFQPVRLRKRMRNEDALECTSFGARILRNSTRASGKAWSSFRGRCPQNNSPAFDSQTYARLQSHSLMFSTFLRLKNCLSLAEVTFKELAMILSKMRRRRGWHKTCHLVERWVDIYKTTFMIARVITPLINNFLSIVNVLSVTVSSGYGPYVIGCSKPHIQKRP